MKEEVKMKSSKRDEAKKGKILAFLKMQKECIEKHQRGEKSKYEVIEHKIEGLNNVVFYYIKLNLKDLQEIWGLKFPNGAYNTYKRYKADGIMSSIELESKKKHSSTKERAYSIDISNVEEMTNKELYPRLNRNVQEIMTHFTKCCEQHHISTKEIIFGRKTARRIGYILKEEFASDVKKFKEFLSRLFYYMKEGTKRLLEGKNKIKIFMYKRFKEVFKHYRYTGGDNTRKERNQQYSKEQCPKEQYSEKETMSQETMSQGTMSQGTMSQGTMSQDRQRQCFKRRNSIPRDSIPEEDVSWKRDTVSRDNVSRDTVSRNTVSIATLIKGIVHKGTMSQGTMSQGTMSQGTMSQGTMSQGTMSQGTMSQGTMSQEKKPSLDNGRTVDSRDPYYQAKIAAWKKAYYEGQGVGQS